MGAALARVKGTSQKLRNSKRTSRNFLKDKWQFIPDLKGRVSQLSRISGNKFYMAFD